MIAPRIRKARGASPTVGCPRCRSTKLSIHQREPWARLVNVDGVLGFVKDATKSGTVEVSCLACPWSFRGRFEHLAEQLGLTVAVRL